MKKSISIILAVLSLLCSVSVLGFAEYTEKEFEYIEFGSYPQSEVTDPAMKEKLNSRKLNWVSYDYLVGTGKPDGSMKPNDFMKYADVEYKGCKYRAVTFTNYRNALSVFPLYDNDDKMTEQLPQNINGYHPSTTYWFRYEPIKWRVLDSEKGLVLSESIIDSQAFADYIRFDETIDEYCGKNNTLVNDWGTSSIREFLNGTFFSTSFSAEEQKLIKTTVNDNTGGEKTLADIFPDKFGSGKTCSVVIPCLLNTHKRSLIITDPKGELLGTFGPVFKKRGYSVLELNIGEPKKSKLCFDPIAYCENDDDISRLAEALMSTRPPMVSDRFWDYSSQCLAELFLRYTIEMLEKPTFADFMNVLLTTTVAEEPDTSRAMLSISPVLDRFAQHHPNHPLTNSYRTMHEIAPKTLLSVFISLRATVRTMFTTGITEMFNSCAPLDINRLADNKTVLFIHSDGNSEGEAAYINLIYETLIKKLMKKADRSPGGRLPVPVHFIMDDFACGSCIKSFPKMLSTFRSKGISSTIILQDESQLTEMYGQSGAKTILNNNDTLVYLGGNDMETANDISRRLNVPLEDVLYMPLNKAVVFRRGSKPVITERYPVFDDPLYIQTVVPTHKERSVT